MSPTRGKRIALTVGILAIVGLVVAGIAAKDRLREEWHIRKLSSENDEARYHAADALVAMKSVRGAREMIRLLKGKRFMALRETCTFNDQVFHLVDPLGYGLLRLGPVALEILRQEPAELPQADSIIEMIEVTNAQRGALISIGSPNWSARYPVPPRFRER